MFDWFRGLRKLARDNLVTKLTAIFLAGSMSHKVAVVIGLAGIVIGVWQFLVNAFVPLLIAIAGLGIIQIAIKDHEASKKEDDPAEKDEENP